MSNRLSRDKVINWAVKVAGKEGLRSITLTRIANDLGVTQPALYRHVDGMQDIRKALALRARDLMAKDLIKATAGLSGKEAVRALASTWRRAGSLHPALLMITGEVAIQGDPELEASVGRVVEIISGTLDSLDLDQEETVHASRALRSALHGFSVVQTSSGQSADVFDATFEQLITLIWIGLETMRDRPPAFIPEAGNSPAFAAEEASPAKISKIISNAAGSKAARLTPDDVVETAASIANEHGLDAVSLTRIAKELGVRQPALYRHVEGIEALWRALAIRAHQSLLKRIIQAAIGRSRDEAIAEVAAAWRRYVRAQPGTYSSMNRAIIADDVALRRSSEDIVRALTLVLRGYSLSAGTAIEVARCIQITLHGFCLLEKDGAHPHPYDLDDSFHRMVGLLIAGIKGMAAAESVADDRRMRGRGSKKKSA